MVEQKKHKIHLEEIPKSNPFKAPEGYFDDFQNKIADRIIHETKSKESKSRLIVLNPRLTGAFTLSAAALIIIALLIFYPKTKVDVIPEAELAEIYKFSAINEISDAYLINQLEASLNNDEQLNIFTSKNEDFGTEALDYLNKENVDLNTLLNAL